MPYPQRHPAHAIHHPERAASRPTWLLPLTGLALAVCGLALIVAGMPGPTTPALPEREVRTDTPELARPAGRAAIVTPLRLGWTSTPLEDWSDTAGTDPHAGGRQASDPVALEARGQPRERFLGEGMGRDPLAPFAGWDLRRVLEEMANDQHGFWRR